MKRHILFLIVGSVGLARAGTADITAVRSLQPSGIDAALGTEFTYQGQLLDGSTPANGAYDFRFRLYDDPAAGSQVGSAVLIDDVTVVDGLFSVQLDFGSGVFGGNALYLQIDVRPGASTSQHTPLSPRQPLTAAPYAAYAQGAAWAGLTGVPAGFADGVDDDTTYQAGNQLALAGTTFDVREGVGSGLDADLLDGQPGSHYLDWGNLTSVPAGFADGVDDDTVYSAGTGLEVNHETFHLLTPYRLPQSCRSGEVAKFDGGSSTWICAVDDSGAGGTFWSLTGNLGTDPAADYVGTGDAVTLTIGVNGTPALRLVPTTGTPNLVGGNANNTAASGAVGVNIGGGGTNALPHYAGGNYAVISGGIANTAGGLAASVGGGSSNNAVGDYTVVGGGFSNSASASHTAVGGGESNLASDLYATVGGGYDNTASNLYATVGGGTDNLASGETAQIGGGLSNTASGDYATVGVGESNTATGAHAAVGGGSFNTAGNPHAAVAGGYANSAGGVAAGVSGGASNQAGGNFAAVGGGMNNIATSAFATVGGGYLNHADALTATIGGGEHISVTGAAATGGGGSWITVTGDFAAVGGGIDNSVSGHYSTIGGGQNNNASFGSHAAIGGGQNNNASFGSHAAIGGGYNNNASYNYSFIGGGHSNIASSHYAFVGGGSDNNASSTNAAVAGGHDNTAFGQYSFVGGGNSNVAIGSHATIGGGYNNSADGWYAMVPGGGGNSAEGDYSFAAGTLAYAKNDGCFVWGDTTTNAFNWVECNVDNAWVARATGGVNFYTNSSHTAGSYLAAGGSSWNSVSDRNRKENLAAVDTGTLLDALADIDISTWNYIGQNDAIRHIGPMAQDFNALLPDLGGEGAEYINSLDADGVALAAIQALHVENRELAAANEKLLQRVVVLEGQHGLWKLAIWGFLAVSLFLIGSGTAILVRMQRLAHTMQRDQ